MIQDHLHCEDFITQPDVPECVKAFVIQKRSVDRAGPQLALFANLKEDRTSRHYQGYWQNGVPVMSLTTMEAGTRVRVVMASRFGDVGVTEDLTADHGYGARLYLDQLENFGEQP